MENLRVLSVEQSMLFQLRINNMPDQTRKFGSIMEHTMSLITWPSLLEESSWEVQNNYWLLSTEK